MRSRSLESVVVMAVISVAVSWVLPVRAAAQATAPAGTTSNSWTPPRTPDGQPDLQSVWRRGIDGGIYSYDIEAPAPQEAYPGRDLSKFTKPIVDPPDGKIPYQPWAREKREYFYKAHFRAQSLAELDPQALCVPGGPPRMTYQLPFQILQMPGYVVFLSEWAHLYRVVPLDGRPHLTDRIKLFMGDSRGHWDGDTLVVEVTNNNGRNWLDVVGEFHSDAFRVVERWTRIAPDNLGYEATIEDPQVYTRPWKMAMTLDAAGADYQLLEEACYEGNRAQLELRSRAAEGQNNK